jgi:hypothetical protein
MHYASLMLSRCQCHGGRFSKASEWLGSAAVACSRPCVAPSSVLLECLPQAVFWASDRPFCTTILTARILAYLSLRTIVLRRNSIFSRPRHPTAHQDKTSPTRYPTRRRRATRRQILPRFSTQRQVKSQGSRYGFSRFVACAGQTHKRACFWRVRDIPVCNRWSRAPSHPAEPLQVLGARS